MNSLDLTDEEYENLKKKLHQAHDKVIKITLHEKAAMRELLEKIVMPLLQNVKIDLDSLKLDTTTERAQAEAKAAAERAQVETEKKLQFKTVMHGWHRDVPLDVITNMVDLPQSEVKQLMHTCEKVKTYYQTHVDIDNKKLKQLSGLSEPELKALLALLQK